MKSTKKTFKDLPFEEEQTYQTKFQTGEKFLIKEIVWNNQKTKIITFKGIFEDHPHSGICPLNADRLVPDQIEDIEILVCNKCGEPI